MARLRNRAVPGRNLSPPDIEGRELNLSAPNGNPRVDTLRRGAAAEANGAA